MGASSSFPVREVAQAGELAFMSLCFQWSTCFFAQCGPHALVLLTEIRKTDMQSFCNSRLVLECLETLGRRTDFTATNTVRTSAIGASLMIALRMQRRQTITCAAAEVGDLELLRRCNDFGATLNESPKVRRSLAFILTGPQANSELWWASSNGHLHVVQLLVEGKNATINHAAKVLRCMQISLTLRSASEWHDSAVDCAGEGELRRCKLLAHARRHRRQ